MYVRQNWPLRLGAFLAVIGLISLVLPMFGYQLRYLMWADGAQPFLGIGLILVGLALVIVPMVLKRSATPAADQQQAMPSSPAYGPTTLGTSTVTPEASHPGAQGPTTPNQNS